MLNEILFGLAGRMIVPGATGTAVTIGLNAVGMTG